MALPTAYHVIFYSYPLTLSLLSFPFTSDCPTACSNLSVYQMRYCVRSHLIYTIYHGLFLSSLYRSQQLRHSCLAITLALTSTPIVKKKRTAAQFFNNTETNSLESLLKANINSDKVSKHLESRTKINYNRMLVLQDK